MFPLLSSVLQQSAKWQSAQKNSGTKTLRPLTMSFLFCFFYTRVAKVDRFLPAHTHGVFKQNMGLFRKREEEEEWTTSLQQYPCTSHDRMRQWRNAAHSHPLARLEQADNRDPGLKLLWKSCFPTEKRYILLDSWFIILISYIIFLLIVFFFCMISRLILWEKWKIKTQYAWSQPSMAAFILIYSLK